MDHPNITDVNYSDGVLKVDCKGGTTFVINRQVPNKQLWYSSPVRYFLLGGYIFLKSNFKIYISGPARYEYSLKKKCWMSISKSQSLEKVLFEEIDKIKS